MNQLKINIFFNNNRGLEVYNYLSTKKIFKFKNIFLSKKFLNQKIVKYLNQNGHKFKIIKEVNNKKIINLSKNIDINLVCGFPYILNKELLDTPKHGSINLHGGKLPKYRGGSPLNWQIINNEKYIGISIIQMDEGIDTGPILLEKKIKLLLKDDIKSIHLKVNNSFPKLTDKAIRLLCFNHKFKPIKQKEKFAKYFKQRNKNDGKIMWDKMNDIQVFNLVRAITEPYPCAFTTTSHGKSIRIIKCKIYKKFISGKFKKGELINIGNKKIVKCKKGYVEIVKSLPIIKGKLFFN